MLLPCPACAPPEIFEFAELPLYPSRYKLRISRDACLPAMSLITEPGRRPMRFPGFFISVDFVGLAP